ncbi:MAG: hypothetical protein ACD_62C00095G0003 [uncultured bacterium]|nr:MAG: hypothetical protein ACD_62C00095G0003 [uncultured bacterium]
MVIFGHKPRFLYFFASRMTTRDVFFVFVVLLSQLNTKMPENCGRFGSVFGCYRIFILIKFLITRQGPHDQRIRVGNGCAVFSIKYAHMAFSITLSAKNS